MGFRKDYVPEVRMIEHTFSDSTEQCYSFEFRDFKITLFNRVIFNGIWRNIRSTEDSYSSMKYSYTTKQAAVNALKQWFKGHGICAKVVDVSPSLKKAVYDVELLIKE